MKKLMILAATLGVATTAIPAAAIAAPAGHATVSVSMQWQNINARQARIDQQIDRGVRNGSISRREATQLRSEFRRIASLEAQYRRSRPGLTQAERRDLDRRFDVIERRVRVESADRNGHGGGRNDRDGRDGRGGHNGHRN